jgi:hypothetical protein
MQMGWWRVEWMISTIHDFLNGKFMKKEYPYGPLLTCLVPGSKVILCSNVLLRSHIVGSANNSLQPFKISDEADKQLT